MPLKRNQNEPNLLKIISEKTELEEGEEAVRRILSEVFKNRKISTKKLAYLTKLPVPVTAAVRRELENKELLARKGGAFLTEKGEKFVKEQLGLVYPQKLTCPTCEGRNIRIPDEFIPIMEKLRDHCKTRPKPLPWLDQAYEHLKQLFQELFSCWKKETSKAEKSFFWAMMTSHQLLLGY